MIKEIIVVEGKDDTRAIQRAVEADTIETGGSAINAEILKRIKLAQHRRGVIIFTDPDHAGERIRKIISERIPGCKHAFLTLAEATYKGDVGIENASPEYILKALNNVKTEFTNKESQVLWDDLIKFGLIHHEQAAGRRLIVGNKLGIGYCNGKQFFKRCKIFQIKSEEFLEACSFLSEEGG